MMQDKLKAAFDSVRAEEDLKSAAFSYVTARCRGRGNRRRPALLRLAPAMVLALCLILAGWGGWQVYHAPTAVISVDVNPSLELTLNRFDRVIGVEGWNNDGTALAETLELNNLDCAAALDALFTSPAMASYLTEDAQVSIVVVGEDADQQDRLLAQAAACTADRGNFHCGTAEPATMEAAHETGLSCGKYLAYLELQALDPDITPQEVGEMSMAEIRREIEALSGQEADTARPGNGSGFGSGYGNDGGGYGDGNGSGHHGHHGA